MSSITKTTDTALGILYWLAQLIIGLHDIAIKIDNKNGTTMALAAFMPAKTTTSDASINSTFSEGEYFICMV